MGVHLSENNILITDLRLSEKGIRCIEGIFRAISGPVPGPIEDCENSCLGSIKPFITGIREDIPVRKHINTTNQQCIKQCLAFKIYHNVMCQFGSPENENLQKKNIFTVMHLRDYTKRHRYHQLSWYKTQSILVKVKCVIFVQLPSPTNYKNNNCCQIGFLNYASKHTLREVVPNQKLCNAVCEYSLEPWIGESLKLCWNLRPQLANNAYGKCTSGGDTLSEVNL